MKTGISCFSLNQKMLLILTLIISGLICLPCAAQKSTAALKAKPAESFVVPREQSPAVATEEEPYVAVEVSPEFPGGDTALLSYINRNINYPAAAKALNVRGKVIVRFCITVTGSIDKVAVLQGLTPETDAEAMRVVGSLPDFNPGKQGGETVPVWFMVPVNFPPVKSPPPPPPPSTATE